MDLSKKRKSDEISAVSHVSSSVIRAVIEPLSKDQLINILVQASDIPAVVSAVRSATASDITRRKLFVRGLGPETSSEALTLAFSLFGEIEEAVAVSDKTTGKPRGFGFVVFRHVDGALSALESPSKRIDGRMTVAQLASAGNNTADVASRKVYVGGIPSGVTADRLLAHFMSYGEVEEGPLGFDNQIGKPKRFAFFIYKTEEGARASLVDPIKTIDGGQIVCKLAVDGKKEKHNEGDLSSGSGFVNPGNVQMGNQLNPFMTMLPRGSSQHVPFYDHGFERGAPNSHFLHERNSNGGPTFRGGRNGPDYFPQINQPFRGFPPGQMYPPGSMPPPFY